MKINANYKSNPILLKYFKKFPCRYKNICINYCINSLFRHLVLRSDFRNNFFNVTIRKCHSDLVSLFTEGIKRIFSIFKRTSLGKRKTNFAVGLLYKLKNCILCRNAFFGAIFIKLTGKDVVNIDVYGCHFVTSVFSLITTIHNIQNNFFKVNFILETA